MLLDLSGSKIARISSLPTLLGRSFNVAELIGQIVSDRLLLAGEHLRNGDNLFRQNEFRTSISRHYYAMYHAARGIVFASVGGDDYQQHRILPRNLPGDFDDRSRWEGELTAARLTRNEADYDLYPVDLKRWELDARNISAVSSEFIAICSDYALEKGLL
ncbi:MAG: hypothetical protein EON54_13060 [Alcaligenaceae bacterium]|nr:MAG: hypothetical protein EON54_13060 [Alcaligenaceae bacterium]